MVAPENAFWDHTPVQKGWGSAGFQGSVPVVGDSGDFGREQANAANSYLLT